MRRDSVAVVVVLVAVFVHVLVLVLVPVAQVLFAAAVTICECFVREYGHGRKIACLGRGAVDPLHSSQQSVLMYIRVSLCYAFRRPAVSAGRLKFADPRRKNPRSVC